MYVFILFLNAKILFEAFPLWDFLIRLINSKVWNQSLSFKTNISLFRQIYQSLRDSVLGIICCNFLANDKSFSTSLLFGRMLEIVDKFYLGDTRGARGGAVFVTNIRSEWSKFRDLVPLLVGRGCPLELKKD